MKEKMFQRYSFIFIILFLSIVIVDIHFCMLYRDLIPSINIFGTVRDPCRDIHIDPSHGNPRHITVDDKIQKVLVTGGSGFIGSNLVTSLLELGYSVNVLDNLTTGNILYLPLHHPNLTFFYGDVHDKTILHQAMEGVQGLFHLAAASKVLPSLTNATMATFNVQVNAIGTAIVLEAAQQVGIKRIVYAASSTYYGNSPTPFQEDSLFSPTSPYSASKYMGELQMHTYDDLYNIPTVSLRYFMVYGPRNPSTGPYAVVTGKFINNILKNEILRIEGTGNNNRDFVHVDDLIRANILAMQHPSLRNRVINVGSGSSVSINELADMVDPINQIHVKPRLNDLRTTLANTCRAKNELQFEVRKPFKEYLLELIEEGKKKNEFIDSFWTTRNTLLEQDFLNWSSLSLEEKNNRIREKLEYNQNYLLKLKE